MSAKITLTTAADGSILGVFLDGLPQGSPVAFLAAHPQHALAYAEALRVHVCQQHELDLAAAREQLKSATAALDLMREEHAAALAQLENQLDGAIIARDAAQEALGQHAKDLAASNTRIAQLERQVANLVGKYEAKPYFQVHALPAPFDPKLRPHWTDVTHVGVRRAPEIGGAWLVDLLREMGSNEFARIVTGVEIPADPKVTSYTELKAESFTADLAAWHTAQNTPAAKP